MNLEQISKLNPKPEWIEFLKSQYPNLKKIKCIDIIRDYQAPIELLHWLLFNVGYTKKELELYYARLEVTNSKLVFNSSQVQNSEFISRSKFIENSSYVTNSSEVKLSSNICDSQTIENSQNIYKGQLIYDSRNIINSITVSKSHDVVESEYCFDSHNIWHSQEITNSSYILSSKRLINCHFCNNCTNLKNSLFCADDANGELLLFNKAIEQAYYNNIFIIYDRIVNFDLKLFKGDWKEDVIGGTGAPDVNSDIREIFSPLNDRFIRWVKTLPNYDPEVFFIK